MNAKTLRIRVSRAIQDRSDFFRWSILATILTSGAALRLFHLGTQSFWLDEAYSALIARRNWLEIVNNAAQDTLPPLHFLLLHLSFTISDSDITGRLLSAFCGILTIPLLYCLASALFDEMIGVATAVLLAVNPFHIFYSQEARMYGLLGFLSLLAVLFFWHAWQKGKAWYWLGFSLSIAAALYTHIMAFLILVGLGAFCLLDWHRSKAMWQALIASMGIVALLFLPWLLYLPGQVTRVGQGFWVQRPSISEILTVLQLLLFGYALPTLLSIVALVVGLYVLFLSLVASWRALRKGNVKRRPMLFVLCLSLIPIFCSFFISLIYPIFLARTLILSGLMLLIFLAWGLTRIHWPVGVALIVATIALASVSLYNYYASPVYAKPPMREASSYVQDYFQPADTVLHSSDSSYLTFAYYRPNLDRHFLAGDPDYLTETTRSRTGRIAGIKPQSLDEIIEGKQRLWLVVALDHNLEYQRGLERRISGCYPLLQDDEIGGIQIKLYDLTQGESVCP